jgi:beta-glucosidase
LSNKDSPKGSLDFPKTFMFGSSTSAFQIEGAGNTEWKGFIGADGTRLDKAIDHYRKFKQDLKYILYLGNAYRFSMDWSKLQKSAYSPLDHKAVSHYMEIFKTLRQNDKKIMLVINHFSNPLWLAKKGGWTNRKSVEIYFDYLKKILKAYSYYIDYINTFNEPNGYAIMAYIMKEFPPRRFNPFLRRRVLSNMKRSHSMAYDYIKEHYPHIKVGISHACMYTQPLREKNIWQKFLKWFLDYYMFEHVHEMFTQDGKVDYIGFSYYGRILISGFPVTAYEEKGRKVLDKLGLEHDDMWENYPAGIYYLIKRFYKKHKKPIIITENGICTNDDRIRIENIYNHLYYIKKALDEGIDVAGYFHWSTFDNYELSYGPSRRFGLVSVDFDSPDLKREIKESGEYYHRILNLHKLVKYKAPK